MMTSALVSFWMGGSTGGGTEMGKEDPPPFSIAELMAETQDITSASSCATNKYSAPFASLK